MGTGGIGHSLASGRVSLGRQASGHTPDGIGFPLQGLHLRSCRGESVWFLVISRLVLYRLAFDFVPGIEERRDCALRFEAEMFGVVLCAVRTHSMQRLDARVGLELQRLVRGCQKPEKNFKASLIAKSFTGNLADGKAKSYSSST